MKNQLKIQYMIGKSSLSEKYSMNDNFEVLKKQFELSIPLITGARITYKKNKKNHSQKIYVGKEIPVKEHMNEEELFEKYNITLNDIADVAVLGYDRVCLLNFKKYDTVVVGVEENAIVVPDYFALKNTIHQIQLNRM